MEINIFSDRLVVDDFKKNKVEFWNVRDCFGNKSRIPLHVMTENGASFMDENTVLGYILKLFDESGKNSGEDRFTAFALNLFIAEYAMKSALPVKACEIGSDNGNCCGSTAELLGKFNPESHLCLVCQSIGNDGGNAYLDSVAACKNPPELSVVVSDYDKTNLQSDNFDIVIINDSVSFEKPRDVVREAHRIVKNGGLLLCIAAENSELANEFCGIFDALCRFAAVPGKAVIKAVCDKSRHIVREYDFAADIEKTAEKLRTDLKNNISTAKINEHLAKLSELIDYACKNKRIESKIFLINIKELLIYYKINMKSELRKVYKARLADALKNYRRACE